MDRYQDSKNYDYVFYVKTYDMLIKAALFTFATLLFFSLMYYYFFLMSKSLSLWLRVAVIMPFALQLVFDMVLVIYALTRLGKIMIGINSEGVYTLGVGMIPWEKVIDINKHDDCVFCRAGCIELKLSEKVKTSLFKKLIYAMLILKRDTSEGTLEICRTDIDMPLVDLLKEIEEFKRKAI